ncbi:DUF4124 domain-containing protein [Lysobacter sp. KIS68-7]|uniref:DUF4124 domain-containing protein n=1 Tax=Lysobacter sp. KIS68-7 TaxID=2904252 RepID=UPI001E3C16AB|nr:DUF4124 domain-containing protein [Lysobacter sp. KIS68-7]UHQ18950.1 DUF4124 domain-containing protein [Lysobacter sp. KIS68-7]
MTRMSICCAVGLAGVLAAGPAAAGELFRCVAADGGVSWQDAPCADGSRLSRAVPIRVDAAPDPVKPAKRGSIRKPVASSRTKSTTTGRRHGIDSRGQRRLECEAARKERQTALDRLGLKRTFAQLRSLDDQVSEACKGL